MVSVRVGHAYSLSVPELPEMQALAERLDAFLAGRTFRAIDLLGFSSLRTYTRPVPTTSLGKNSPVWCAVGKYLIFEVATGVRIVIHLSQAGRLDVEVPPKSTRPTGSVARFTFDGTDAQDVRAVLVREHGTQRKASWWVLAPGDKGHWRASVPNPIRRRSPS